MGKAHARGGAARAVLAVLGAAIGLIAAAPAQAARLCDAGRTLTAAEQDRLLRFGAVVREHLQASGERVALVARSGLDLERFALRYSHAGISLAASPETPWAVRQLYYDCDSGTPRLFDQGLAGFVMGGDEPRIGYLSVLLLPAEAARELEAAALDRRRALTLLAADYSANAYAFGLRYQNCNQWVAELLAEAWRGGGRPERPDPDTATAGPAGAAISPEATAAMRARAQAWLRDQGYVPHLFAPAFKPLVWAAVVLPWLHVADHPAEDLEAARLRVSMPSAIEAFVRQRYPAARRIEFCHDERRVVVRQGWAPIGDGCEPAAGDEVLPLV